MGAGLTGAACPCPPCIWLYLLSTTERVRMGSLDSCTFSTCEIYLPVHVYRSSVHKHVIYLCPQSPACLKGGGSDA